MCRNTLSPSHRSGALRVALIALAFITGCDAAVMEGAPVSLRFQPLVAGSPAVCGAPVHVPSASIQMTDLRFYVHDVRYIGADGTERPAALVPDGRWQTADVALMDFEDGTGPCENGSPEINDALVLEPPAGPVTGVRFRIGVPFAQNHDNPATNPSPLNVTAMSWGWMGGHKFLRLEAEVDGFDRVLHLASTGCRGTIGDIRGCERGNRPEIEVRWTGPVPEILALRVDALLGISTDGAADVDAADVTCMSTRSDAACLPAFRALGLDLESGEPLWPSTAFEGM